MYSSRGFEDRSLGSRLFIVPLALLVGLREHRAERLG